MGAMEELSTGKELWKNKTGLHKYIKGEVDLRKNYFSGENDRVFIYFTDHGGVGLIAFPEGIVRDLVYPFQISYISL